MFSKKSAYDRASGRSQKKKSNFAGFSYTRKKWPISREFRGNFRGQFSEK